MRTFWCGVVCSLALWGCESDVDLCGGGSVCGIDGNPYGSYCEAGEAGVDVAYAGTCNDMCDDITCRIDCQYGFLVEDGCPVCSCAPPPACTDDTPCTRGDVCRDGSCMPPLPETDAGTPDAEPTDVGPVCPEGEVFCGDSCKPLGTLENCMGCRDTCSSDDVNAVPVCDRATGCGSQCNPGYGDCDDDGFCEPLDSKANCGSCGNVCPTFGTCDFDEDATAYHCNCPAGRTDCGGTCVNTNFDGEFCGGCGGPSCAEGERCRDGSCGAGDACTNPANWYCAEGEDSCDVACGGINFFGNPADGSFTCTVGGTGISCFVPPAANCDTCIDIAARCCFGG